MDIATDRNALIRTAFRLEYLSIAWMAVEAAVAIGSARQAGSVSLLAFGIDSLIEIASAGVLIWRLSVELRHGQAFAESAEHAASRIAGGLLLVLAVYVVTAAGWKLWTRTGEEFSWPGLTVTALAMPIMYGLARRKLAVAAALGSRALRADAMEVRHLRLAVPGRRGRTARCRRWPACGGPMPRRRSASSGSWSARGGRPGAARIAATIDGGP